MLYLGLFVIVVTLSGLIVFPLITALLFAIAVLIWFALGALLLNIPAYYIALFLRRPPDRRIPNYNDEYIVYTRRQTKLLATIRSILLFGILLIIALVFDDRFIIPSLVGIVYWYMSNRYTEAQMEKNALREQLNTEPST